MIRAALFDRDGTLIADGTGTLTLMRGAVTAIARLRAHGLRIGVVTNQPRAGRDDVSLRAMEALHERIEARVGKLDGWFICTHSPEDTCVCRKPQPGLILQAAHAFGVAPHECVVIGDIGKDVDAALQAGARGILVPTPVTLREEIAQAPVVCRDLLEAADRVLGDLAA
jgi:D-glycero-D-manno-heptose 1,7-bisphosphate phosphatase